MGGGSIPGVMKIDHQVAALQLKPTLGLGSVDAVQLLSFIDVVSVLFWIFSFVNVIFDMYDSSNIRSYVVWVKYTL